MCVYGDIADTPFDFLDRSFIDGRDIILFIEEVEEPYSRIDRMFQHLILRGAMDKIKALGIKNDLLEMGLDELIFCFNRIKAYNPSAPVVVDLSLIRGFDYYTGSVYEVALRNSDFKDALGGGGRYDNLASTMTKTKLPGVGMTFGVSRLLGLLVDQGVVRPDKKSPAFLFNLFIWASEKS